MLRRLFGGASRGAPEAAVPADTVVYAIGDIHGRADLLDTLHDKIAADASGRAESRRVLVYLGDYVDRGLESRAVLDRLIAPPDDGLERICLKGNHEDAMLRFLDDPDIGASWLGFGGDATLYSYGVDTFGELPEGVERLEHVRRQLVARLPDGHRRFLETLALSHEEGGYFFVHAGVRPDVPIGAQAAEDLMWIRDEFLYSRKDFGKVVVHGHSIQPEPVIQANRIGIDTGAFATGMLTALILTGTERSFLRTP